MSTFNLPATSEKVQLLEEQTVLHITLNDAKYRNALSDDIVTDLVKVLGH